MIDTGKKLLLGCVIFLISQSAIADDFYRGEVGLDYWWASTKISDVRYDEDKTPFLTLVLETELPYAPHFKFRYSEIDSQHTSFDKYDFIFYYDVMDHESLALDLGINASNYKNSRYTYSEENVAFNMTTWSFYANGAITIPNTNLDIIGQFDFYNSGNKKTADFIAGFEYTLDLQTVDVALRTGYRVMDYTFNEDKENEATVFIDGWFVGMSVIL
ncbi:TIGR04219 family outer membrane beta-barrel protein [Vibrio algarum]|uniref:TIGR04219 family outer membrane beta-barrel protein n=1 Tax=Vibrio algarum TaxID=3020714 RepID=A0ABT4YMS1_9VIBR|nr:TIGR04219 family outer membrane beta-barrel protein [Vibrio sp. KJ40-1]MDB1122847.1 TIGR04219 family outer membrane beta-barrel protein [Vibrio sp. KJ40-1]